MQVEDEEDHYPILPGFFAERLVRDLEELDRATLLLEALADPKGIMLDELGGGLITGPEAIPRICVRVIESNAEQVPEVPERMKEQWEAYWLAYPDDD